MKAIWFVALGVGLAACGSSGSGSGASNGQNDGGAGSGADASGSGMGSDAGAASDASGDSSADGGPAKSDAGSGSGTVTGTADGNPFPGVASAYWIGAPDSASTTVVYVFSKAVKCSDLAMPGWDARIPTGTQLLEMKSFGTTPATYKVTQSMTPAPGEASVNYVLTAATPTETIASGGTVTLTKLTANVDATGAFALKFGANAISGTFDATYCAGGHEP